VAGVCNATRMRLALAWALLIKVPGVNQAARRIDDCQEPMVCGGAMVPLDVS
jgi:hypothetical protein